MIGLKLIRHYKGRETKVWFRVLYLYLPRDSE